MTLALVPPTEAPEEGTSELGRLRVLAGELGLPQTLWSHLPPEEECGKLREYLDGVLSELERRRVPLERYLECLDYRDGVGGNVARLRT